MIMKAENTERFPPRQRNCFRIPNFQNADNIPHMSETFHERFTRLVEASPLKPQAISKAAGLDKDTVRKLLANPEQKPSVKSLSGLADVLGVSEQYLLKGINEGEKKLISSFDPDAPESRGQDADWDDGLPSVGFIDGRLQYKGRVAGASPEVPAAAGAGQGHIIEDRLARIDTNGIASGHPVSSEWLIPADFVRHGLGAQPSQIIIVPVVGHSMEPRLYAGDRVMVDISQSSYVGDAIYVFSDGDDVLKVKTLSKLAGSNPARFRIISESSPDRYDELQHDEFRILGRVVGRFSRM